MQSYVLTCMSLSDLSTRARAGRAADTAERQPVRALGPRRGGASRGERGEGNAPGARRFRLHHGRVVLVLLDQSRPSDVVVVHVGDVVQVRDGVWVLCCAAAREGRAREGGRDAVEGRGRGLVVVVEVGDVADGGDLGRRVGVCARGGGISS